MVSSDFRQLVLRYLEGSISLEELEERFLPKVFDLIVDPDSGDSALAAAIELGLAEMMDGIRDEDGLRHELRETLDELCGVVADKHMIVYRSSFTEFPVTSSSSTTSCSYDLELGVQYHRTRASAYI